MVCSESSPQKRSRSEKEPSEHSRPTLVLPVCARESGGNFFRLAICRVRFVFVLLRVFAAVAISLERYWYFG